MLVEGGEGEGRERGGRGEGEGRVGRCTWHYRDASKPLQG